MTSFSNVQVDKLDEVQMDEMGKTNQGFTLVRI